MHNLIVISVCLGALFTFAVAIAILSDKLAVLLWRFKKPATKVAAERKIFEQRVCSPDWLFYEQHLEREVRDSFRQLFLAKVATGKTFNFGDLYIAFNPIDSFAIDEQWVLPGILSFADSDGDAIFLQPGALVSDGVFIAYHDGGDIEELTPDVETFFAGLRETV